MNTDNKKRGIMKILMPTVILPVSFAVIIFLTAYIVLSPYFSMITSALSLVSTDSPPSFNNGLESIFVQRATEQTHTDQTSTDENANETVRENHVDETIEVSDFIIPKYEQHYANLTIPALGVECKLYYGDSDAVLKEGAGQYIGSRLPGFGAPILIGAHNKSYFKELEWVEIGQIVKIETSYGIYKYEIYETRVAKDTDSSAYDLTLDEEILMLYTCYPFGTLGYNDDRLFVYGRKISGPVVSW